MSPRLTPHDLVRDIINGHFRNQTTVPQEETRRLNEDEDEKKMVKEGEGERRAVSVKK